VTKGVEFCRRDDGNAFAVIELTGEVDVATNSSIRALLRAAFTRALAADAPVVIDCRRVTFLGLSGVTALLEAKQRYRLTSRMRLVGAPGGPVDRMVSLLGVHEVFEMYPTVADASFAEDHSQPADGNLVEPFPPAQRQGPASTFEVRPTPGTA
jgi:anti-anti-sigma factor